MAQLKKMDRNDIEEIVSNLNNQIRFLNNKKILLLGSGGFLGKYFVRVFDYILKSTKNKFYVDCFDNFISSNPEINNATCKKISFIKNDIIDYKFKKNTIT